jgi:uncharacterized protein involved in exopolysaccharide biosynthesis
MAWHKPSNFRDWVSLVLRHRKKAFFPAILVMVVVLIAGETYPKEYSSEGKFQRVSDAVSSATAGTLGQRQVQNMRTQVTEEITGRAAVEQLIEDLKLRERLRIPQDPKSGQLTAEGQMALNDLIQKLRGRIRVYPQAQTESIDLYVVSYTDDDKELVPQVINQLVENYIRRTSQDLDQQMMAMKSFYDKEKARWDGLVIEFEQKKMRFETDNQGMLPDDPQGVQKLRDETRRRQVAKSDELATLKKERDGLDKFIKEQPDSLPRKHLVPNPEMEDLRVRKRAAEADLDHQIKDLNKKPVHPDVVRAQKALDKIKEQMGKTAEQIEVEGDAEVNVERIQGQKDLKIKESLIPAVEAEVRDLTDQVAKYDALDRNFYRIRNEYVKIQNDLTDAHEQRKFWDENLRRTNIAITSALQQQGMRLSFLQRAPDQIRPSRPTVVFVLGVALAAALGVAGAMILLAELLDRSFHSVEQAVDDLKLPVLGAVNEIVTPALALRRRVLGLGVVPAFAVVLLVTLGISYYLLDLNLNRPQQYEALVKNPKVYLKTLISGG